MKTRLLGRNLGKTVRGPASGVWFVLIALSFSPSARSQQSSDVSAPEIASSSAASAAFSEELPEQQARGTISGTVMDGSGAVIVGARVTLTVTGSSASREVQSGEDGQYSFTNVAPGAFQISVSAAGFVAQVSSGTLHDGEFYIAAPTKLLLATVATEIHVTASRTEVAAAQIRAQEKQRVIGVFPNFYVTYIPDAVPLNSKQKFHLAFRTMIDPVTFVLTGATAGVQQAQNDFSGYGPGALGYAKRFGATYTDDVTSTFIGSALLPSLLKQDPRYFYKGTGSVRSRILYAIANAVICKGDNQRWQPNYSAILGGFASGAISNLYYPPKDRGVALVFETTLIGTGETAVVNLLQEFLIRKLTPHASQKGLSQRNDPSPLGDPSQRNDPSQHRDSSQRSDPPPR
jgi:Carboxypeptidase regulatory-like domain